ncbi:MAG: hypothetical protein ACFFCE_13035 [Promethearchaeota archaeon]
MNIKIVCGTLVGGSPRLSGRYDYKLNLELVGIGTMDKPYLITSKLAYQDKLDQLYLKKKKDYNYVDLKNYPSFLKQQYTLKGYKIIYTSTPQNNSDSYNNGLFSIFLSDSNSFLEFKYLYLKSLDLSNCQNISISDSILEDIILKNCSNISIQEANIGNQMKLLNSYEVKFSNSYIYKIDALSCGNIIISNCSIEKISKKSKKNVQIITKDKAPILKDKTEFQNNQLKQKTMFCQYCKSKINLDSLFCDNCGERIN